MGVGSQYCLNSKFWARLAMASGSKHITTLHATLLIANVNSFTVETQVPVSEEISAVINSILHQASVFCHCQSFLPMGNIFGKATPRVEYVKALVGSSLALMYWTQGEQTDSKNTLTFYRTELH